MFMFDFNYLVQHKWITLSCWLECSVRAKVRWPCALPLGISHRPIPTIIHFDPLETTVFGSYVSLRASRQRFFEDCFIRTWNGIPGPGRVQRCLISTCSWDYIWGKGFLLGPGLGNSLYPILTYGVALLVACMCEYTFVSVNLCLYSVSTTPRELIFHPSTFNPVSIYSHVSDRKPPPPSTHHSHHHAQQPHDKQKAWRLYLIAKWVHKAFTAQFVQVTLCNEKPPSPGWGSGPNGPFILCSFGWMRKPHCWSK